MPIDINGNILSSTSITGSTFSNSIITDGLILHLDAGNKNSYSGSGATWTDLSGNGYNATLINSVGYSSNSGGMLTFNGSTQVAQVNVNSFVRNNTSYTFSTFFYLTTSNGGAPFCLMTTPNNSDTTDGFWQHLNLGPWYWRTEDAVSGEFGGSVESSSTFVSSTYYHLTVIVTTNSIKFYRNGILIPLVSTTFSWANLRTDNTAYLYIGKGYEDGYYMTGNIGNFLMYNRVLNNAEILANYYGQKSRFGL
jgi:hypothetical protein